MVSVQVHGRVDRTSETSSCGYQESEQRISQSPSVCLSAYVPCLQDLCFCTSWSCRMLASQRLPLLMFLKLLFLHRVCSCARPPGDDWTRVTWLGRTAT